MKNLDRAVERALLGERYLEFCSIRDEYAKAIEDIREHLKENPLLPLYEKHINGKVVITETGQLVIVKKSLPTLKELRDQAERCGIDISDLGRSRTKISQRLENKKEIGPQRESPISNGGNRNQKVQSEVDTPLYNNTENQAVKQDQSSGDFDFLDDIEEESESEGNPLEQSDPIEEQTEEEKRLIQQMLLLGSRGGSLDRVADKVDLVGILNSQTKSNL